MPTHETDVLTVVCWLFQGHGITSGGKPVERDYTAEHVNRLVRLLDRHLTRPHRVVCITDRPHGLACLAIDMPGFLDAWPKAYRKLWVFSREFAALVPGRIFVSDLDVAIVGPLDDLLDRHEQMVVWRDPRQPNTRYSSGNYLFTAGRQGSGWPLAPDAPPPPPVPQLVRDGRVFRDRKQPQVAPHGLLRQPGLAANRGLGEAGKHVETGYLIRDYGQP